MDGNSKNMEISAACRGCITELLPNERQTDSHLVDMFLYCTNLQVNDADNLPKHFCQNCAESLASCYEFVRQARQVDITLRNLLARTQTSVIVQLNSQFLQTPVDDCVDYFNDSQTYVAQEKCVISAPNVLNNEPSHMTQNYNLQAACEREIIDPATTLVNVERNEAEQKKHLVTEQDTDDKKSKDKLSGPYKAKICKLMNNKTGQAVQSTDGTGIQCPVCQKVFVTKIWLNKHLSAHSKGPFICIQCSKRFPHRYRLKQHEVTHSSTRPFSCHSCPKKYKLQKQLNFHLRSHHNQPMLYKCDICGVGFKLKGVLVAHITQVHEEKSHLCHLCGAAFSQSGNLSVHLRVHTGAKPYGCRRCAFSCSVASSLRRHERRHDGARPHTCALCGKSFHDASGLSRHKRTHTGELPYPCSFCSQAFIDSWKRKSHIMKQHRVAFQDVPRAHKLTRGVT